MTFFCVENLSTHQQKGAEKKTRRRTHDQTNETGPVTSQLHVGYCLELLSYVYLGKNLSTQFSFKTVIKVRACGKHSR